MFGSWNNRICRCCGWNLQTAGSKMWLKDVFWFNVFIGQPWQELNQSKIYLSKTASVPTFMNINIAFVCKHVNIRKVTWDRRAIPGPYALTEAAHWEEAQVISGGFLGWAQVISGSVLTPQRQCHDDWSEKFSWQITKTYIFLRSHKWPSLKFREFTVLAPLIEKMNRISAFPLVQTMIFITDY